MSRKPVWHHIPHVRTGDRLTFGERQADRLKRWFGSWPFLGILNGFFIAWVTVDYLSGQKIDPGLFYANLALSWLAAQQGGALQIAANRGDRIASELAQHTYETGQEILTELRELRAAQCNPESEEVKP